ncbi:MAG: PIN domain-containing protein [bacterium]
MKTVYLDPSIPSACCETSQPQRRKITREWWKVRIPHYRVIISRLTVEEIKALKTREKREAILSLIGDFSTLEISPLAERLARRYLEEKIIPPIAFNDALHLALAVVNKVDIFVSWDFAHLVKSQVERKINAYNLISGYPRIRITTPEELMKQEGG